MNDSCKCSKPSRVAIIIGWVLSVLPALLLLMASSMNILQPPDIVEQTTKMGYRQSVMLPLGLVTVGCVVLYLVPQTAILGAILLTGYLGGAVDVHVRNGDPLVNVFIPVIVGIVVWLGIYLREPRLRRLVPFRCTRCCKSAT